MTKRLMILLSVMVVLLGCTGVTNPSPRASTAPASPSPTEFRHGPEGLIADLSDAGADAEVSDSFDGEPLASVQTIVCVSGEDVRVFAYASAQERAAVSARIDTTDPTNIGTSIVEWDGRPKFWQRDRIIVLYLGRDQDTIDLLTQVMGEPFAEGQDRPQRLPGAC